MSTNWQFLPSSHFAVITEELWWRGRVWQVGKAPTMVLAVLVVPADQQALSAQALAIPPPYEVSGAGQTSIGSVYKPAK